MQHGKCIPAVSAESTGAAIATRTAAGVFVVGWWTAVGSTAACVARSAARVTAARKSIGRCTGGGVYWNGSRGDGKRGDIAGRARDAFTFGAVEIDRSAGYVIGIDKRSADADATQFSSSASAKTQCVCADCAAESKLRGNIDGENATDRPRPTKWSESGTERGGSVLRN